jgi:hypothetical protein
MPGGMAQAISTYALILEQPLSSVEFPREQTDFLGTNVLEGFYRMMRISTGG